MQDLTTGSITRHLAKTTGFMLVMMVFQTLYFLVDLYWVGRLGTAAVAGVAVAGNLTFIVLALGQMLGVGTTTVIAHAAGRRDQAEAQRLFIQSQLLAVALGGGFLLVALAGRPAYARAMSADAATARLASDYLRWFIPAMALQFPLGAMGAALRGIGLFKPGVLVSTVSVILNMVLAPFLIFGWGTGRPFGVQGAAMSSLVAIAIAIVWMARYFVGARAWIRFAPGGWVPELPAWRRMLGLGLPAGFEFAMMAVYQALVYTVARPFGAAAQAGFGIGMRIIQAGFMPVVALGMSVAPVAAQNVGARLASRVKATWRDAAIGAVAVMLLLLLACQLVPPLLVRPFARDPRVVAFGVDYLRIVSFGFVASGLIFVTSSMFQAMGNTMPSLFASGARMVLLALPLVPMARQPGFRLEWIWFLSVATTHVQLLLVLWMLRREYARRLDFGGATPGGLPAAGVAVATDAP
ncbi:MAG TPA: MATE family efflux transporter [Gemmatimonadaceae bacterium]